MLRCCDFDPEPLANDEQFPLEHVHGRVLAAANDRLAYDWFDIAGNPSDDRVIDWHVTPAEEDLALFDDDLFEFFFTGESFALVRHKEDNAHGVFACGRELDTLFLAHGAEELVRHLNQDAGTVARLGVAAARAAMLQVFENLDPLLDDLVALRAVHVYDEPNAAGIAFLRRIVHPLCCRIAVVGLEFSHDRSRLCSVVL